MTETLQSFGTIGLFVTIILIFLTIIAFFMVITERKHDSLPKKINLNCSNCNTNNLDFQTLTINPKQFLFR